MKKRILSVFLVLVMVTMSMVSCTSLFGDVEESGVVTVVVESADGVFTSYEIDLSQVDDKSEGTKGVLDALAARDESPLHLVTSYGDFGAYVTEIGSIKNGDEGKYIIVYTSVAADAYLGDGVPTLTYEGVTLYQSGKGVSSMAAKAGAVILFRLESF